MKLTDPMRVPQPPVDCCTYIRHVKRNVFPPAIAELEDEVGYRYAVFANRADVVGVAEYAREAHAPCYLAIKTSVSGNRYVTKITIVPTDPSVVLASCYKCGRDAVRMPASDSTLPRFECRSCHAVMFLAPPQRKA